MTETRKLAAILVADVVGYSRLAGADEDRTLSRLRGLRSDLIDPAIAAHRGRIVKRTGDGSLIEFRSVVDAVRCAIEVQNGVVERNAGLPPERRIEFRVGVHLGDVVEESDGDLMGDGSRFSPLVLLPCHQGLSDSRPLYAGRRPPSHQAPGGLVPEEIHAPGFDDACFLTTRLRRVHCHSSFGHSPAQGPALSFWSNAHHHAFWAQQLGVV